MENYGSEKDAAKSAFERLRSLSEETQMKIANKYYGGKRPWMEKETPKGGLGFVQRG